MSRRKKLNIDVNNIDSLQELMQEVYYDACSQIKEAQGTITTISNAAEPMETDDHAKIAKSKTDAMKIKDSAIKIKLEVAKLQNDILKKKAEAGEELNSGKQISSQEVGLDSFSKIRDMIKREGKTGDE